MRSNCLIWALALHRRRVRKGHEGYLLLRRSRWGPFPHALYGERRQRAAGVLQAHGAASQARAAAAVPGALRVGRLERRNEVNC